MKTDEEEYRNRTDAGLAGYREIAHTADWALNVWGPDLNTLLLTASEGMYALSEMIFVESPGKPVRFFIQSFDEESLLVDFLSELLYLADMENIGVEDIELSREGFSLEASGVGKQISQRKKEIKAVTYHNLKISRTNTGYKTMVVFDV